MSTAELPDAARTRGLVLAAERLSASAEDLVPGGLRPYRRFHPRRLVQLAPLPLATALEVDPAFRQLVAGALPEEVATAVRSGTPLPAAPPEDLAAAAYLLRPAGWEQVVLEAAAVLAERDRVAGVDAVRRADRAAGGGARAGTVGGRAADRRAGGGRGTAGCPAQTRTGRGRAGGSRRAGAGITDHRAWGRWDGGCRAGRWRAGRCRVGRGRGRVCWGR